MRGWNAGSYTDWQQRGTWDVMLCSLSLGSLSAPVGPGGGSGAVAVNGAPSCVGHAVSNVPWIAITSGATVSGGGSVGYSAAANPTASQRTGTVTIAGQTFTLTEATSVLVALP